MLSWLRLHKYVSLILTTLIMIFILYMYYFARPVPGVPKLYLDKVHVDFGRMKPLETSTATVYLENRGGATLRLDEPTATCGCQTPVLAKRTLMPGERTT